MKRLPPRDNIATPAEVAGAISADERPLLHDPVGTAVRGGGGLAFVLQLRVDPEAVADAVRRAVESKTGRLPQKQPKRRRKPKA